MDDSYQDATSVPVDDASVSLNGNGGASSSTADGPPCIGRVGAPPQKEATSTNFFFWLPPDTLVETTQLITCLSTLAGIPYTYHAIVSEVYRQSRKRSMGAEIDEADGDLNYQPPFENDGFTYASASILRSEVFTPPLERSPVYLASAGDARTAYGAEDITNGLDIGLIKNGANRIAGPGCIDLDYLLGTNGGHMNVNGSAGRGTKSSFLLFVTWLLLYKARLEARNRPSDKNRLRIVPIILNVKGLDLFYIDHKSTQYDEQKHLADWQALCIEDPKPFENAAFYAPQTPGGDIAVPTGRRGEVKPYSWSLSDIIVQGLFSYLFAEVDANDSNFSALVMDIESWLTSESTANDGTVTRSLREGENIATFRTLLDWVDKGAESKDARWRNHHPSTWKKLYRRLLKLVYECRGVLRIDDQVGNPLQVTRSDTIVALDELNRFAPRGATDAITRLIENVAAEMRSQGIILLGAQQQASKVSEKVIENAALRVLGRTGTLELDATVWRFLSASAKSKATVLPPEEKLVIQDNFREPMHIRVPFPVWAMNPKEAAPTEERAASTISTTPDDEIATY